MEQATEVQATTEVNENSSTEQILANSPDGKAEAEASQAQTQATDKTGAVEKTQVSEEDVEKQLLESKKPIPYDRFSQVIKQRNEIKKEHEEILERQKAFDDFLSDPSILRTFLSKQGYTKEQIDDYFREQRIEEQQKKAEETQEEQPDLNTAEGWQKFIDKKISEGVSKALGEYDQKRMSKEEAKTFVSENEAKAQALCKDVYGINYGTPGKDEKDVNTGVGKIAKYLKDNPGDAHLGHAKILKLALAEEGFKKAEEKGTQKEKERQQSLKNSALEGDETTTVKRPDHNSAISDILAWRKLHPDEE